MLSTNLFLNKFLISKKLVKNIKNNCNNYIFTEKIKKGTTLNKKIRTKCRFFFKLFDKILFVMQERLSV